jgi:hypothetical protein
MTLAGGVACSDGVRIQRSCGLGPDRIVDGAGNGVSPPYANLMMRAHQMAKRTDVAPVPEHAEGEMTFHCGGEHAELGASCPEKAFARPDRASCEFAAGLRERDLGEETGRSQGMVQWARRRATDFCVGARANKAGKAGVEEDAVQIVKVGEMRRRPRRVAIAGRRGPCRRKFGTGRDQIAGPSASMPGRG